MNDSQDGSAQSSLEGIVSKLILAVEKIRFSKPIPADFSNCEQRSQSGSVDSVSSTSSMVVGANWCFNDAA
jgi:hypothetical protein